MKKITFFIASLIITLFSIVLYLKYPFLLEIADNKIKDNLFRQRGEINSTDSIVIVDIDEKSLSKLGQWPWSRDKLAVIVNNLSQAKAGVIGFDIFFPEKTDKDKIFAKAILNSPSILGFNFDMQKNITKNSLPNIPAIFIYKGKLLKAKGYVGNVDIIQNSAYSAGFLNTLPDSDGVIRKNPLIITYDQPYPSLAFEMFRVATGINKVVIKSSAAGIEGIELKNYFIPTDRFARLYINFRGKKFKHISIVDVYNNTFDKNLVKHKFVLIGSSAAGLYDLRSTPLNSTIAGVDIQANILDNLIKGDFLRKPNTLEVYEIIAIIFISSLLSFAIYKLNPIFSFAIVLGTFALIYFVSYKLFLNGILIDNAILFLVVILISILYVINYLFEIKRTQKLKKAFAKKVSPQVMEEILKSKDILKPKEKEISIFFSDIRSFTSISEKLTPKELIEMLNIYMTQMSKIIIKKEGTIDKFIGDAIMAYWNAPTDIQHHADKAVESAIEQIKQLKKVNEIIKSKFNITIDIGIGINTGIATIGEMGSEDRSDYTTIGDSVNLASRLEGLNKLYNTHIIISENTKKSLTKPFFIKELDKIRVKGKKEPVKIYEVMLTEMDTQLHETALKLYYNSKFKEAIEIFEKLKPNNPKQYEMYINRCKELEGKEFDGVYNAKSK